MTKREMVIRGLECCMNMEESCESCPFDTGENNIECFDLLHRAVLEELKSDAPTKGSVLDDVLTALSICLPETEANGERSCNECPYGCFHEPTGTLPIRLIEDIRALLKAKREAT